MKICIDPGHGMSNSKSGVYDPGAIHAEPNGMQITEAEIVLRYSLTLRDILRAKGVEVFMTRDDATDHAPVVNRAALAEKAKCDMLISIHVNSVEDKRADGIEVLYGKDASKPLAQALQDALVKITKFRDRKIKLRTDLAVLRFKKEAVLIELGFIKNDADREKLLDQHMRSQICQAIADTISP